MPDLNDYYYFHAVVTHQGFSAAARRIGVPKGTLSKRVARLEERLQVRLLERSTRRLRTTEVGRAFYEHCQTVLAGMEAAEAVAAQAHAEPIGVVRASCPSGLMPNLVADLLPAFMAAYPKVRVLLKVFNRPADLIEDGVDVALRVRTRFDTDLSLTVRRFGKSRLVLTASPAFRDAHPGVTVDDLAALPTLSMTESADEDVWELLGPDGETRAVRHRPRLLCGNFDALLAAARQGLGVALLPEHVCRDELANGELVPILPDWQTPLGTVHAVFSSRKGLVPAVRAFIDFLAAEVPRRLAPLP